MNYFKRLFRRLSSGSFQELSRAGKVAQILWDASQIQKKQNDILQDAGRVALDLLEQNKIDHPDLEKALARFRHTQRILKRQDQILQGYQRRGDIRSVLQKDKEDHLETLAPV